MPNKTYELGFICKECGKKIPDLPARDKGLVAQHFCKNKCYDAFYGRLKEKQREQRRIDEEWKNLRPPVQEY